MIDPRTKLDEGLRFQKSGMLEQALDRYEATTREARDPALLAEALRREAEVYRAWSKWEQALSAAHRSAEVASTANLEVVYAEAVNSEAAVYLARGEFERAIPLFEQIIRTTSEDRLRGIAFQNMGAIAAQKADLESAERYFQESYRCYQRAGYAWGEAFALNNSAAAALDRGKFKLAAVIAEQAMQAAKKIGDLELLGIAAMNSAEALAGQLELTKAEDLARSALDYFTIAENELRRAECLRVLGDILLRQGNGGDALESYQQALEIAERLGVDVEIAKIRDCMETVRRGANGNNA